MGTERGTADVPSIYLQKLVRLITGTRAMGRAVRTRDGYLPYSAELDFATQDIEATRSVIEWVKEQAPYGDVQLVEASAGAGLLTIFARVDVPQLARYLAGRALLSATGELWEPAKQPLAAFVEKVIEQTVGAGGSWPDLSARLAADMVTLAVIQRTIEAGEVPIPPPAPARGHPPR